MSAHIIVDLSALIGTDDHKTPRGIPRVELAYAKHFLKSAPDRLTFTAYWGRLGAVPGDAAATLVEALDTCWAGLECSAAASARAGALVRRMRRAILFSGDEALYDRGYAADGDPLYLIVSHPLLGRMPTMRRIKERTRARFVCFVHDLIGIEFPSFVPARQRRRHRQRMDSIAHFADAVIANSAATGIAFNRRYEATGFRAPIVVAPLGIEQHHPASIVPDRDDDPYFVCLATIEPRKNHRLLFRLWRRLAAERGRRAPRLVLIGRRGWKSKGILAGQSTIPSGLIKEHNSLSDAEVARLLVGAQALLYPTFAEGYGLPVAEALAMQVPVLCSDLAELREVGQGVPEYLDPSDEPLWAEGVRDYAEPRSPRRQAQLSRITQWRAPSWERHFAIVEPLLTQLHAAGLARMRP
jgi:glycosyltransferase involved in cell wall biosynthesis